MPYPYQYQYQYSNKIGLPWVIDKLPKFLFPDLSKKKDRIEKPFCGVIALHEKTPVGLILSTFNQDRTSVRIHSMLVHPQHRCRGIGRQLVATLEDHLQREGARKIDGHFRSHWKSVSAIYKIIGQQGWSEPREDLIIVKGESVKALSVFTADTPGLPVGYRFAPYSEISGSVRQQIALKKKQENWYLDYLDPFINESTIFQKGSFFLKQGDHVVGWLINHLIAPDLAEFTALFVDPKHRPFKLAYLLMRQGIAAVVEQGVKHFIITTKADNPIMSKYVVRHTPAAELFMTKALYSSKELPDNDM